MKINSKWIIALNVKFKTMTLPEDNTGENLDGFRYDTFMIPKRMDKPDFSEIKNFYSAEE